MGQIHLTLLILVCTRKNQTLKKSSDLYFSLERGPLCSEEISWVWNLSSHMCSLQGIGNYKAESKYYLSPVFLEVWQFVHDSTHTLLSRDRTTAFKRANTWGKCEKGYILLSWAPKSLQTVTAAKKVKDSCSLEKKLCHPRQRVKQQRHGFANKGPSSQGCGFSSGHIWMWELDCEEGWAPKNWCFWTVVLEKTLESPWDCKEIQRVRLKWDQSWVFIGRTYAEAETPILWPPHAKSWLIEKDLDAGRDWGQEE